MTLRALVRRYCQAWWFSNFRWWRRLWGGHWERWWVVICYGDVWHDVDTCSKGGCPPTPLCRGTPICEHYE